jgi:hypothetical protein
MEAVVVGCKFLSWHLLEGTEKGDKQSRGEKRPNTYETNSTITSKRRRGHRAGDVPNDSDANILAEIHVSLTTIINFLRLKFI